MPRPLPHLLLLSAMILAACGAETATTAASKAADAKATYEKSGSQAKESLDRAKKELEKASQLEQQRADPLKDGY